MKSDNLHTYFADESSITVCAKDGSVTANLTHEGVAIVTSVRQSPDELMHLAWLGVRFNYFLSEAQRNTAHINKALMPIHP